MKTLALLCIPFALTACLAVGAAGGSQTEPLGVPVPPDRIDPYVAAAATDCSPRLEDHGLGEVWCAGSEHFAYCDPDRARAVADCVNHP